MTLDKPVLVVMTCTACQSEFPDGTVSCPKCGADLVAEADPLVGTLFAERYEIVERIGKGGMGIVYKAHHKLMDQYFAIKVLYKQYSKDQPSIARFQLEAKTLAALRHPNILTVNDFGISPDNQPFLIMEYLDGTPLSDFLEEHGRMPLERAINIFAQACDGLAHAHEKGVIHRDFKPGNLVLIQEPGHREQVKIVDFGIAKIKPRDGKEPQNLTKAGEIFGSPLYMSPEQCQGKPLDERSDIYSLGCVIYETLTGMPPLMGINSFETMTKHVNEMPPPMRDAAPALTIPSWLDAAVMKALKKNPDDRQHSVNELKRDLIEGARSSDIDFDESEQFGKGQTTSTATEQHEKDRKEKEELQKLVEAAVLLTQRQDARAKELRQLLIVLYCLLGVIVVGGVIYFTKPGPIEDPAPNWQKQAWRSAMDNGDKSMQIGQLNDALADYKNAENIGRQMGPIYDKQVKAQLKILNLYKQLHQPQQIKQAQTDLLEDLVVREQRMYGGDTPDADKVKNIDEGLISKGLIDPKDLDSKAADNYSRQLIQNAKDCFAKKKYTNAESWLRSAIEMEELAHGHSKGELTRTARGFMQNASPQEKAHMQEIDDLMKRAEAAEADEKE
jgi:serine/threonine-protein kinase